MMGLIETTSICKAHQFLQYTPSDPSTAALIPEHKTKSPAPEKLTSLIDPGKRNTRSNREAPTRFPEMRSKKTGIPIRNKKRSAWCLR
jgi:hypothetical protein